jgi:hypothetical protein
MCSLDRIRHCHFRIILRRIAARLDGRDVGIGWLVKEDWKLELGHSNGETEFVALCIQLCQLSLDSGELSTSQIIQPTDMNNLFSLMLNRKNKEETIRERER